MLYGINRATKRKSQIKNNCDVNGDAINPDSLFFESCDVDEIEPQAQTRTQELFKVNKIEDKPDYIRDLGNKRNNSLKSSVNLSYDDNEDIIEMSDIQELKEKQIFQKNRWNQIEEADEVDESPALFLNRKRILNDKSTAEIFSKSDAKKYYQKESLELNKKLNNNNTSSLIHDMDQLQSSQNEEEDEIVNPEEDDKPDLSNLSNLSDLSDFPEDKALQSKISQIKNLREKKREIEFKEEKYDQDYVEVKQSNVKEMIKDVYNLMQNSKEDSDSDRELLEWELGKLKHGMSAHWNTSEQMRKKEKSKNLDLEEVFGKYNMNMKSFGITLEQIKDKVRQEVETHELQKISLKSKWENIQLEIEENQNKKNVTIQKIDDYISQYQNLKKIYAMVIKDYKKHGEVNLEKIKEKLSDEVFYFSE